MVNTFTMLIPAHLEPMVRELAATRLLETHQQFRLLERIHGAEHAFTAEARRLFDEARELSDFVKERTSHKEQQ